MWIQASSSWALVYYLPGKAWCTLSWAKQAEGELEEGKGAGREEEGKGEIGRATKATIIINHIQEGSSSLVPEERIQRQAILSGCISWF